MNKLHKTNRRIRRRRLIIVTLLLCAFMLIYLMLFGEDTRLNRTLANGSFFLAGSIIGAYVFGTKRCGKNEMNQIKHGIAEDD